MEKHQNIRMKKEYLILFLTCLFIQTGFSQHYETKRQEKTIIENRAIYLNGGLNASFGGASRTSIKIDLPPNTVKWYYSFSTSEGKSGTKNLELALQLGGMLTDPSGLTSTAISGISVPQGEANADILLCSDNNSITNFLKKYDSQVKIYQEGTVQNTKQAVVEIDDVTQGTFYLGIRNPSTTSGVNINIEVVAITEEQILIAKSDNQQKAELYANLAVTHMNKGEYEKCIEYCDKANSEFGLGWVSVNKGIALMMMGKDLESMEIFVDAITKIKKETTSDQTIDWAIKTLDNIILRNWNMQSAKDARELFISQR